MTTHAYYRALCAEFVSAVGQLTSHGDSPAGPGHRLILTADVDELEEIATRARILLAAPEAVELTDEKLLALRSWSSHGPTFDSDLVSFARAVLSRYGTAQPAPVPVGERLPGVGDMNEEGEIWVEEPGGAYSIGETGDSDWEPHKYVLRCIEWRDHRHNHRWLPHWALPLPEAQP